MIVVATNQFHKEIELTNRLKEVIELVMGKIKKYEELGRIDKSYLITEYLNKIYLVLRYWVYSGLSYQELDACIEKTIECSLQELKEKLKILPRELWLEIALLINKNQTLLEGIDNLEIIGLLKDNNLTDLQSF